MKNKIGWCNTTWNPVWGCLNNCEYCYARKMAKRFYKVVGKKEYDPHGLSLPGDGTSLKIDYLKHFVPRFLKSQFDKKFPKKPQRIFVGSMSEIYYWEPEWIEMIVEKVKQYPQHTFQFLTKFPRVYADWVFPSNCWLGVTSTRNYKDGEPNRWDYWQFKQDNKNNLKFVSFEPLLMEMNLIYHLSLEGINWVIIETETGNRKGKIIPKREWIESIVNYCRDNDIPIYLKDNLKEIYPVEIKEFPGGSK